ncbi:hypothetical protein EQZ20_07380 [Bacillus glycinifermentans]|uniref:Uncharacterized protein n=1 Tax=Bacillus glycinifermentans TaxID=1664069 RepID=A0AAJ4D1T5_9BACI|nr:hypothetical protein [Bacillus glycinifermentans]QAT64740.1 hypothetical protein EQZ20_07380 [Bacillus glycinifermentans]
MKETPFYKTNWFTILMIIVLFPVGLILMWANKKWTFITRIIVSCIVVVLAIVGYYTQSPQSEKVPPQVDAENKISKPVKKTKQEEKTKGDQSVKDEKETKTNKEETTVTEETKNEKENPKVNDEEKSKEEIEKIIEKTVGEKSGENPKISDLEVSDLLESDTKTVRTVNVTLNGNDNLTTNMIREGMLIEAKQLMPKIFEDKKVGRVILTWKFPLIDLKGNSDAKKVLSIQIERKTNDEINWDHFNFNNFNKVADHYYEHPALSKE